MGGGGWCKVIFVSNPTPVEVGLSRVDVAVGVVTIALMSLSNHLSTRAGFFEALFAAHLAHINNITKSKHNSKDQINIISWPLAGG